MIKKIKPYCSSWLSKGFSDSKTFNKVVDNALKELAFIKYDIITCKGISGLLFAPIIAHEANKPLSVIREKTAKCNANNEIEFSLFESQSLYLSKVSVKKYVVIDDLIETGKTIKYIDKIMKKHINSDCRPVAYLLYSGDIDYDGEVTDCGKHKDIPIFSI